MKKKQLYGSGDPTEDYQEFREYTKEELFEDYCNTNVVPDVVIERVIELQDINKTLREQLDSKNNELRSILCLMENSDLDLYKNQLKAIIKI